MDKTFRISVELNVLAEDEVEARKLAEMATLIVNADFGKYVVSKVVRTEDAVKE